MKACSKCGVVKALDGFYKRSNSADGRRKDCCDCVRAAVAASYEKLTPEQKRARSERTYAKHAGQYRKKRNQRYAKNPEPQKVASRADYHANKELRQKKRNEWGKRNRARLNAAERARQMRLTRAMPPWADPEAIRKIYELAQLVAKTFNTPIHVDHIVPLKHKLVCGLHCEHNLQILPGADNLRKHNKFEI